MTEEEYTKHIETWGKVERKGKNNPYTAYNGHMFTFFAKNKGDYLAVRLSKEDQAAFVEEFNTEPVIQYNSVMNGYVEVPEAIGQDYDQLKQWLDKSFEFICSLEPKPSKKKKA